MKKIIVFATLAFAIITGVLATPVLCCNAEDLGQEAQDKSELIAGEEEKAAVIPVGEEGMTPVYGEELKDGTYPVEVESSSSMFRIVKAELTVHDGDMTAVITLSGKGYLKMYMGTGEEAIEAEETEYIPFVEDSSGAYTYIIPVEALNQELECTSFSKRKEKWYDRQILFQASSLPEEAFVNGRSDEEKEQITKESVKKGAYTMEVSLSGGSGRAEIMSPASINVTAENMTATIEWDSPYYDYMIVDGEKFFPINEEGNSVFEIPVLELDQEMAVIADTTAMSTPHEIVYTLTFHSASLQREAGNMMPVIGIVVLIIIVTLAIVMVSRRKKKGLHGEEK